MELRRLFRDREHGHLGRRHRVAKCCNANRLKTNAKNSAIWSCIRVERVFGPVTSKRRVRVTASGRSVRARPAFDSFAAFSCQPIRASALSNKRTQPPSFDKYSSVVARVASADAFGRNEGETGVESSGAFRSCAGALQYTNTRRPAQFTHFVEHVQRTRLKSAPTSRCRVGGAGRL